MTAFPRLINQIGGTPRDQRQSIIDHLGNYALVILDDLKPSVKPTTPSSR